jgi:hypothetical protein
MSIELDFDVEPETLATTNPSRAEWTAAIPAKVITRVETAVADRLRKRVAIQNPANAVAERAQWDALYRAALSQVVPDGSLEINPRDELVDGKLVAYTWKVVNKRKPAVRKPKTAANSAVES